MPSRSKVLRPYLSEAEKIDRAVYASVAATSTPQLDGLLRHLNSAAN